MVGNDLSLLQGFDRLQDYLGRTVSDLAAGNLSVDKVYDRMLGVLHGKIMRIASETAGKLKKKIGDLPFSFLLSWYKQKTVCILQTLLKLGFGDILMGPSMPEYISPFLLDYLEKNFGITMGRSSGNAL